MYNLLSGEAKAGLNLCQSSRAPNYSACRKLAQRYAKDGVPPGPTDLFFQLESPKYRVRGKLLIFKSRKASKNAYFCYGILCGGGGGGKQSLRAQLTQQ